ncbi:MAG: hypothetical protein AAGJ79_02345 [Verrucomicrobiota bacterium]
MSIPASLAALLFFCFATINAFSGTPPAFVSGPVGPWAPANWTTSFAFPSSLEAATVELNPRSATEFNLEYFISEGASPTGVSQRGAVYEVNSTVSGQVSFAYEFSGFHGLIGGSTGEAFLQVFNDTTQVHFQSVNLPLPDLPSGFFAMSGDVCFNTTTGDTITFILGGSTTDTAFSTLLGVCRLIDFSGPLPTGFVTNTNNSGAGSLRQAIADTSSGGSVFFAGGLQGKTIGLSTELRVNKALTIDATALP